MRQSAEKRKDAMNYFFNLFGRIIHSFTVLEVAKIAKTLHLQQLINDRNIYQPQNLVHFRLRPITFIYLHYLQFL